jgi:hypothetical protein
MQHSRHDLEARSQKGNLDSSKNSSTDHALELSIGISIDVWICISTIDKDLKPTIALSEPTTTQFPTPPQQTAYQVSVYDLPHYSIETINLISHYHSFDIVQILQRLGQGVGQGMCRVQVCDLGVMAIILRRTSWDEDQSLEREVWTSKGYTIPRLVEGAKAVDAPY